jgi:hypothetical protein
VTESEELLRRLSTWTERSWRHVGSDGRRRADVVFDAVQQLADLTADAEGEPRRPVPRLDGPVGAGVADQLAVMVHDATRLPALSAAADEILADTADRLRI